jgi:hypothetical protein
MIVKRYSRMALEAVRIEGGKLLQRGTWRAELVSTAAKSKWVKFQRATYSLACAAAILASAPEQLAVTRVQARNQ